MAFTRLLGSDHFFKFFIFKNIKITVNIVIKVLHSFDSTLIIFMDQNLYFLNILADKFPEEF